MNKTKKRPATVRFNSEKEGILIVKVGAFCFAIISWIATAQGLHEYVFDYMWQAYMISFGIQGILFVFNLKLPFYFQRIGNLTPEKERVKRKFFFGKKRGEEKSSYRWTFMQRLIALFYGTVLLSSSLFSFVYICNSVVYNHQSGYVDDNTVLATSYRHFLDETAKYIEEHTKAVQILASKQVSELQAASSQTLSDPNHKTEEVLDAELQRAQTEVEKAEAALNTAKDKEKSAQDYVDRLDDARYWMVEEYRSARDALNQAHDNVMVAEQALSERKGELDAAQAAKSTYRPSLNEIITSILTEILKRDLDMEALDGSVNDLSEAVISIGKSGEVPDNFSTIVQITQSLGITIDHLSRLNDAGNDEASIAALRAQLMDNIDPPDPQSDTFQSDKPVWEQRWRTKFSSLEQLITKLPVYAENQTELLVGEALDTELLESYDAVALMDEIDELVRARLSDINVIERAAYLLGSKYRFTAWFSLAVALFFDVSSLLAGLFIYSITEDPPKNQSRGKAPSQISDPGSQQAEATARPVSIGNGGQQQE